MQINAAGDKLTEDFEAYIPFVYDDFIEPRFSIKDANGDCADYEREWRGGPVHGTLTIGFGTTRKDLCTLGRRCTRAEAEQWLNEDLRQAEADVTRLVTVPLNENQFSALVSFVYNCGPATLARSTLIKRLNAGSYDAVPRELLKFNRSKGVTMSGLTRRRTAEGALWATPVSAAPPLVPGGPVVDEQPHYSGITPDPVADRTLMQTKTVKGGLIAALATGAQQASGKLPDVVSMITDNKDTLLSFADFVPWLKGLCVAAVMVGVALVIYGRYDVKVKTGE